MEIAYFAIRWQSWQAWFKAKKLSNIPPPLKSGGQNTLRNIPFFHCAYLPPHIQRARELWSAPRGAWLGFVPHPKVLASAAVRRAALTQTPVPFNTQAKANKSNEWTECIIYNLFINKELHKQINI